MYKSTLDQWIFISYQTRKFASVPIKTNISYEKFEFLLPKGTKIIRNDKGELVISHKYFKIQFKCDFDGFSTALPSEFEELMLDCHLFDIKTFLAPVSLSVTVNPIYFLFSRNYACLKWIDTICDSFNEKFSFDKYLQTIDFYSARTVWYMRYGVKKQVKGDEGEEKQKVSLVMFSRWNKINDKKSNNY